METSGKRVSGFIRKHPLYAAAIAALLFIVLVVAASLYSNAVIWNLTTSTDPSPGLAQGRGGPQSLTQTLVQYDGFQYTHIAQYGYTNPSYRAFLPLYPLLIRLVSYALAISVDYAALAVSWVSLCAAAVVLYAWIRFELDAAGKKISPWVTMGLIAAFPTAGFFVLPYAESLFLLLTVSALLLYRKEKYVFAGIMAALSSVTRFQGLVLIVFFAADFLLTQKRRDFRKLIAIVPVILLFGAYMAYLHIHTGDALAFISAEKYWGRLSGNIVANVVHSMRPLYLWFIPVGLVGLWTVWKYMGRAYFLYSLAFFLLPISSGSLASINRYMVSFLPMFLGLTIFGAESVPKAVRLLYVGSSVFLLAWSIALFANGYWVA